MIAIAAQHYRVYLAGIVSAAFAMSGVAQQTSAPVAQLPDITSSSIGMVLKLIPAGSFIMGSPDSEIDHNTIEEPLKHAPDESPQRKVTITRPFYLGVHEVIQSEYEQVMGTNPSDFLGSKLPVEKVSWRDAMEFCKKLSELDREMYRLPSEAEWEYACRAGTSSAYYWGSVFDESFAWTNDNSNEKSHDVGTRKPNPWGLHDMSGNIAEWCLDWKGNYTPGEVSDPRGAAGGEFRIIRGGSWAPYPLPVRSAARYGATPVSQIDFVGFRVVRQAPAK